MSDDNWLNTKVVECPDCSTSIFQVDHSPMDDCWRIYCDQCPKSVEVSFYDDMAQEIQAKFPPLKNGSVFFEKIQNRLRPCDCGGAFRLDAKRRCFHCGTEITADTDINLYRFFGCELGDQDPSEEEQAEYEDWSGEFVRTENIWR